MKYRFQKRFAFLLCFVLLFACVNAVAEEKTWQLSSEDASIYFEMTRFDSEMPNVLLEAMGKTRWADWQCTKGIRQDERVKKTKELKGGTALVAVGKDGQTMLLQFVCPDGKAWECVPAAEGKALLTGRSFEFDAFMNQAYPRTEIVYTCEDGGREVFQINMGRAGKGFVKFEQYRHEYADGSKLTISNGDYRDDFFYVETRSASGTVMASEDLICLYPGWMEALDADLFPKSPEDALSFMAGFPQTLPAGYGLISGANIRERTSTKSNSLGDYRSGTLVKILGTKPGTKFLWYKVQVGQTIGYVSEPYIYTAENEYTPSYYNGAPLTVGRVNRDCELKTAAGSNAETAAKLTAGTEMYVLADRGDWLHVCKPRGDVGYFMDIEGTYGYLRASDVTQADTPLRLKYTGD